MSATIPEFIIDLIGFDVVEAEREYWDQTRHRIELTDSNIENISGIREDIEDGKRVLIICNTVKKAQEIFRMAEKFNDKNVVLLHSKFRVMDREKIEKQIKDADVLVATQAVEVSLDIDFDVMYTQIAPISALVQRMGRVNRKGEKGISKVVISTNIDRGSKFVYGEDVLKRAMEVLDGGNASNGDMREMVKIASQWNKKEWEKYNIFARAFKEVKPFHYSKFKLSDEIFSSQVYLASDYNQVMSGDYIDEIKYSLTISDRKLAQLRRNGLVATEDYKIFIHVGYDEKMGMFDLNETILI